MYMYSIISWICIQFLFFHITSKLPQEDFICFYPGEMKMLRTNNDLTFFSEVIVLKKE